MSSERNHPVKANEVLQVVRIDEVMEGKYSRRYRAYVVSFLGRLGVQLYEEQRNAAARAGADFVEPASEARDEPGCGGCVCDDGANV